jgi:hypothetical protein
MRRLSLVSKGTQVVCLHSLVLIYGLLICFTNHPFVRTFKYLKMATITVVS